MKEIRLSNGKGIVLVDDEDYELVSGHKWHVVYGTGAGPYAQATERMTQKTIRMHRIIMGAQPGQEVDHINHNGLDNRRSNLRVCTPSENQHNSKLRSDNKSGYKGVCWKKRENKWWAKIKNNNKIIFIGFFTDPVEAAHAYDAKARELFGEFASPNFPLDNQ
jgi:hypothetical protein